MKRSVLALCAIIALVPAAALAQTPPSTAPPTGPVSLSEALKTAYNNIKLNISQAAEKMPEADYGFKAGPMPEVRSYGGFIGHLANANYALCANAKGEKNPSDGVDFEKKTAKAELVKALNDALAYCDGVYSAATDQMLVEMVPGTRPRAKGAFLFGNVAHNNEHYGNLVTHLRLKGIVPPSTERANQQRRPSAP